MTEFKSGDKVTYKLHRDSFGTLSGTVEQVGYSLLGVRRDGNGQYEAVEKSNARLQGKSQTPAEAMGLKVGDEVEVIESKAVRGLRGRVFLFQDDRTNAPRFIDEHGHKHFVTLCDVRAMPQGPKEGVLWKDAPIGATHYSMSENHSNKWHKLDKAGKWSYASSDLNRSTRFVEYIVQQYARPERMVAIPGVVVEVNPYNVTLQEVKELEAQVREKLTQIENLQREVNATNVLKQGKLDTIHEAGFVVQDGELVKKGPSSWKEGDIVRCIDASGRKATPASLTEGKLYTVKMRNGGVGVVDDDGDTMVGCVDRGCFEWVSAFKLLPPSEWKRGDIVEAVEDGLDIKKGARYTVTGMERLGGLDLRVCLRDDVDFPRRRPVCEFKHVYSA